MQRKYAMPRQGHPSPLPRQPAPQQHHVYQTSNATVPVEQRVKKEERQDSKGIAYLPSEVRETYHDVLKQVVTAACSTVGFDEIEHGALETLMMLFHNYIKRAAEQSRLACEAAGRTVVCPSDVWFGLVNMGHPVAELPRFFAEDTDQKLTIFEPALTKSTEKLQPLHIGVPRPHPAYVHEWMPPLPDPHTYIRTEISNEADMSYEKVRESMAMKRRNGVASLVNYMVRIYPRFCVFSSFESVIFNTVTKTIEAESEKKRFEEAFVSFRSLFSRSEIDNDSSNAKLLVENGLLTKEEAASGFEAACVCKDGSIIDTHGVIVEVDRDAEIDLHENMFDGAVQRAFRDDPLVEHSSHSNLDKMFEVLDAFEYSPDEKVNDEFRALKEKWALDYIPEWFYVLEPSYEHRTYLQSLLADLKLEEETKKDAKEAARADSKEDFEDQAIDNPYFRPPRIVRQRKED